MKIKYLTIALAMVLIPPALAEEKEACSTDQIQDSPNLLLTIVTIPFKMVVALTYGPRCLLANIPKNE